MRRASRLRLLSIGLLSFLLLGSDDCVIVVNSGFTASQPVSGQSFGLTVVINSTTAFIGAPGDGSTAPGPVEVWSRAGTEWSRRQMLEPPPSPGQASRFGASLATDGETAVVGAPGENGDGTVHVFTRSGSRWEPGSRLASSVTAQGFGQAVAVEGGTIVVGHPDETVGFSGFAGTVLVFQRSGGGWVETQRLTLPDAAAQDRFGFALALEGDLLAVGAPGDDPEGSLDRRGSVHLFQRIGGRWEPLQVLSADDLLGGSRFGHSVALDGERLLVGARHLPGAAYVFVERGGVWSLEHRLDPPSGAVSGYGTAVALRGDLAFVSAVPDLTLNSAGRIFVHQRDGSRWQLQSELPSESAGTNGQLGISLGADSGFLAAGAPRATAGGNLEEAGAVSFFTVDASAEMEVMRHLLGLPGTDADVDLNGDGRVDAADLVSALN